MAASDRKQLQWERAAVFIFGVIFIALLIALVIWFPNLSATAYTVFRIVIALAAAGVGAIIPGFLNVEMKGFVRAGGAMALFVIVYFFSPAPPTNIGPVVINVPKEATDRAIHQWFDLVDHGQYLKAWESSAEASKEAYSEPDFLNIFNTQRKPLGNVVKRTPLGLLALTSLPSGEKGIFRQFTYHTVFDSGGEFNESLLLTAENGHWKVLNYNVVPPAK